MTIRLSISSLAGMARTLVAVGTSSDADMFFTTAAAAPRNTCASSPSAGGGPEVFGAGFAAAAAGVASGDPLPAAADFAGLTGSGAGFGCAVDAACCAFGAGRDSVGAGLSWPDSPADSGL